MTVMEVVCLFKTELLTMKKSGQFPDESAKIKGAQAHSGGGPRSYPQKV